IIALDEKLVRDEIEIKLECALAVRDRRCGQPARGHIERHVPPMIDERRLRKTNLADDLRPHVQGRISILPFGERQRRPSFMIHHTRSFRIYGLTVDRKSTRLNSSHS